jgi:hypothetical protein
MRGVRRNATGTEQIADGALEGGCVERLPARNADFTFAREREFVVAAVIHGWHSLGSYGPKIIHALSDRSRLRHALAQRFRHLAARARDFLACIKPYRHLMSDNAGVGGRGDHL